MKAGALALLALLLLITGTAAAAPFVLSADRIAARARDHVPGRLSHHLNRRGTTTLRDHVDHAALRGERERHQQLLEAATKATRGHRHELSDADSADIAQASAVVAWRQWSSYRPEAGTVEAWLVGIVRHQVWNFMRDARARQAFTWATTHEPPTVERVLLAELLAELPSEQRQIVVMHEIDGYTHREIAKRRRMGLATVHDEHARAVRALSRRALGAAPARRGSNKTRAA